MLQPLKNSPDTSGTLRWNYFDKFCLELKDNNILNIGKNKRLQGR